MSSSMDRQVFLKYFSLFILVFQNSALVIIMKLSRTHASKDEPQYITSTAVIMSELIKFLVSLYFLLMSKRASIGSGTLPATIHENTTNKSLVRSVWMDLFGPSSEYKKIMVPAVLYYIQNNLQYVAVSLLDAATFQVTYQLKILTTALFSVGLLGKRPSLAEWLALIILTVGVALVQFPHETTATTKQSSEGLQRMLGLCAVVVACILSGLSGVWFEKVLKGSKASLWVRNTQLALFSLTIGYTSAVWYFDRELIATKGFFYGYTSWTYAAITCQAVGGLIVALVVKYADNILKGFATSISIIVSSIVSIYLFDFQVTGFFMMGSTLVLYATYLYQTANLKATASPKSHTPHATAIVSSANLESTEYRQPLLKP